MDAGTVFAGSDGAVTTAYYAELEKRGVIGRVALNLFRAQKTSTRAKAYRGRRFKAAAYDVKSWAMGQLCAILTLHASGLGIVWGWKQDLATVFRGEPSWVLYLDLPYERGQVSFHSPKKLGGPEYAGDWDQVVGASEGRILAFCDFVMGLKGWPEEEERRAGLEAHATGRLVFGDPESIAMKSVRRSSRG